MPPPTAPPSGEDLPKPPLHRKRTARTVLVTCGIIAAAFVVFCGGGATLTYFLYIHGFEEPLTARDRDLLVTAERVESFARAKAREVRFEGVGIRLIPVVIDPALGKARKVRHLDGSRELEYEYKSSGGATSVLGITHIIGVDRSAEAARYGYEGLDFGTSFRLRLENKDISQVERADLWSWGDTSRCIVLYKGDAPIGNIFMGCKGRRYFQLAISGVYFDNAQAIRELLQPFLQKLESYEG
ncbi:MAG TPA: hypothetical protein VMG10_22150 [Gemmataceae bacterium]|nr:hypothetical protein [Gemmataceae bacterium]